MGGGADAGVGGSARHAMTRGEPAGTRRGAEAGGDIEKNGGNGGGSGGDVEGGGRGEGLTREGLGLSKAELEQEVRRLRNLEKKEKTEQNERSGKNERAGFVGSISVSGLAGVSREVQRLRVDDLLANTHFNLTGIAA
jgi:hypothetical protein